MSGARLWIALGLVVWAGVASAETLDLNRDQAVGLARQAWLAGDVGLAYAISTRIVAVDGADVEALLLLSACEARLGHFDRAMQLGRRAWGAARAAGRPDGLRQEIAVQVAASAFGAGQMRRAVFWMDRAVQVAPTDAQRERSLADLRQLKARVPLSFSGNLTVAPTDNLNNGANSGLWAVDDLVIGGLSGWSVAHAGVVTSATLGAEYDLGVTESGQAKNRAGLTLDATFHSLTEAETRDNPTLDASDLDMTRVALHWTHARVLPGIGRPVELTLEVSKTWFGGLPYADALRAEALLPLTGGALPLTLQAVQERQWTEDEAVNGRSLHLVAGRGLQLPWGTGRVDLSFGATWLRGGAINATYDLYDASLSVDPALHLGPVSTLFGLSLSHRAYDDYVLLGNIHATNGRTDDGLTLRASFGFDRLSVAGMVPTVTLQRQIVTSNISKYETQSTTVNFGLAARF